MSSTHRAARRAIALTAVASLLLAGCRGDDPTIEVEPTEEVTPDDQPTEAEPSPEDTETDEPDATDDGDAVGPTPDQTLVDDPCGPEQGRESEGFITVVSPVSEQLVRGDTVDLVGCSNVHEATVQWSLYDGDGRELETGFTTATCGSGCVGEFAEEIPLDAAAGEPFVELHVYSEDVSDEGGRRYLVDIPLVLG
jgi:hypothetical protein